MTIDFSQWKLVPVVATPAMAAAFGHTAMLAASPSPPVDVAGLVRELEAIRGVLLDGYAVYMALNASGKKLTTAQVSDVLDAVVKLHRAALTHQEK